MYLTFLCFASNPDGQEAVKAGGLSACVSWQGPKSGCRAVSVRLEATG